MINDDILHKWINNTISESELETFKKRPEYQELVALYKSTDNIEGPKLEKDKVLQNILSAPKEKNIQKKDKVFKIPTWTKLLVAACFIGIVGYLMIPQDPMVNYSLAENQTVTKRLPDNSTFKLFENSSITYNKNDWKIERNIKLKGSAYFEVEKGSDFTVETERGFVKVLGTKFTVAEKNSSLSVVCDEGKVSVSSLDKKYKEIIEANESCEIFLTGKSITDKTDLVKMKNVSLEEVLDQISKNYEIIFETGNTNLSMTLNCSFPKNNLQNALKIALGSANINYEQINETVKFIN